MAARAWAVFAARSTVGAVRQGSLHDQHLAPRDHVLAREEDAQGIALVPALDAEDGRVPPSAHPLDAARAIEPKRSEDRRRIQIALIHTLVPHALSPIRARRRGVAEGILPVRARIWHLP